jgi:predicted HTH domain antitoxin
MQITVEVPDELASQMVPTGQDPSRAALEGWAIEAFRAHRITEHELAGLLQLDRYELDGFLKDREVWLEYSAEDLARELETAQRLRARGLEEQARIDE